MPLNRRLSTLEYTVMGILWKTGGATAYAVTQEFTHSETSAYRSGAGSIYPLLKRLVAAGLLRTGGKGQNFEITDAGVEALQGWFRPPLQDEDFSCLLDPLRSRVYFLKVLPAEDRALCISAALSGMKVLEAKCAHKLDIFRAGGDPFSILAIEGSLIETRARIKWLKKLQTELPE